MYLQSCNVKILPCIDAVIPHIDDSHFFAGIICTAWKTNINHTICVKIREQYCAEMICAAWFRGQIANHIFI